MLNKLKEQHKLAQLVAAQKALEEKRKQEEAKEAAEVNKSDPEIIVDDEKIDVTGVSPKETPIVVIDEEIKSSC
jgi:hypothetical protein